MKDVIRKVIFENPPDSNTANFIKDVFVIPTEDIYKKTPGREKILALQKSFLVLKKNQNIDLR